MSEYCVSVITDRKDTKSLFQALARSSSAMSTSRILSLVVPPGFVILDTASGYVTVVVSLHTTY